MAAKVSILIDAVGRLKAFADARAALGALRGQAAEVNRALGQGIGIDLGARITQGAAAGVRALTGFVGAGVKFNATLQETELGLAAIFKSVDRAGRFKTFNDAVTEARASIAALNREAGKSPFEFGELLEQFQLAAPMLSRFGVGLKDQIDFVTKFSSVARVILGDQAAFQAPQELRALLTGQVDKNARIAQIFFGNETDRKALQDAVEAGTVVDLLKEKFASFSEAAALGMGNLNQILSNTKDALSLIGKEMTRPLFEKVNAGAKELKEFIESPAFRGALGPLIVDMQRLVGWAVEFTKEARKHPDVFTEIYKWSKIVFLSLAAIAALNLVAPIASMVLQMGILVAMFPPLLAVVAGLGLAIYESKRNIDELGITWEAWIKGWILQIQQLVVEWRAAWAEMKADALNSLADLLQELNSKRLLGKLIPDNIAGGSRVIAVEATAEALSIRSEADQAANDLRQRIGAIVREGRQKAEDRSKAIEREKILAEETARAAAAIGDQLSNEPLGPVQGLGGDDASKKATKALEQAEELRLQTELLRIQQRRAMIEADRLLPADQQRGRVLAVLEEERAALEKVLAMWEARRAAITEGGPEGELARAQIDREIAGTMGDIGQIDAEALRLRQDAFFESPLGQIRKMAIEAPTLFQQMGNVITGSITGAIDGVSSSLSEVIMGTKSWGQAFREVGAQIVSQLIQMTIRAILFNGIFKAMGMAIGGPAGAVVASSGFAGSYATGGLIPGAPSRRDNRLAAVATGEFVMPSDATSYYGSGAMEAIRRMVVPRSWLAGFGRPVRPSAAFGFAGGGLVGEAPHIEAPKVNIAILNTRGEMREWMESAEGQRVAFDAVSKRTMELGVRG